MGYRTELTLPNLLNSLPKWSKRVFFNSFLPRCLKRTLLMEQYKYQDDWRLVCKTNFDHKLAFQTKIMKLRALSMKKKPESSVYRICRTTEHFTTHLPSSKMLPKCLPNSPLVRTIISGSVQRDATCYFVEIEMALSVHFRASAAISFRKNRCPIVPLTLPPPGRLF